MTSEKIIIQDYLEVDDELLTDIRDLIQTKSDLLIKNILNDLYPPDIAHLMNRLDYEESDYIFSLLSTEEQSQVLVKLDDDHRNYFLQNLTKTELTEIVEELPTDEATDIVSELSKEKAEEVFETLDKENLHELKELLQYEGNTAGGIMQKEVLVVQKNDTVKKAIQMLRRAAREDEHIKKHYSIFVVDEGGVLIGLLPISELVLLSPQRRIYKVMEKDVISVTTNIDQEEVAHIFKKYNLVSIPVVDFQNRLVGKIMVDDIVDVMQEEHDEDVAKMIGSDADEMESRSPSQIALLRLPWVLITLFIELLAGVVIHQFDETLSTVLLLASFMPIISAISGNTGLQSAAIIVRGLATGHVHLSEWWIPLRRQFHTTIIIGGACGVVIGIIGAVWYGKILFGVVVGVSMFISVNISGLVGTGVPMISKSLGFDPAMTAGPFETAFQDVIGISIFLSIATMLLHWLV
ncbi:MAG: magnesium transporter [Bacteroidetes bacterium]|nr:magnesium transporter [Bacteroidota bacterium]